MPLFTEVPPGIPASGPKMVHGAFSLPPQLERFNAGACSVLENRGPTTPTSLTYKGAQYPGNIYEVTDQVFADLTLPTHLFRPGIWAIGLEPSVIQQLTGSAEVSALYLGTYLRYKYGATFVGRELSPVSVIIALSQNATALLLLHECFHDIYARALNETERRNFAAFSKQMLGSYHADSRAYIDHIIAVHRQRRVTREEILEKPKYLRRFADELFAHSGTHLLTACPSPLSMPHAIEIELDRRGIDRTGSFFGTPVV